MGEFNEDEHPRDAGRFTAKGGGQHVRGAERAASLKVQAGEHREQAGKLRSAARAHREAAKKATDPAQRGEHQARANQHDERAARHEQEAARHEGAASAHGRPSASREPRERRERGEKGEKGEGLARWAAEKLEGAKEGVERAGERVNALEEEQLREGGR
jgi:hypothetical protein